MYICVPFKWARKDKVGVTAAKWLVGKLMGNSWEQRNRRSITVDECWVIEINQIGNYLKRLRTLDKKTKNSIAKSKYQKIRICTLFTTVVWLSESQWWAKDPSMSSFLRVTALSALSDIRDMRLVKASPFTKGPPRDHSAARKSLMWPMPSPPPLPSSPSSPPSPSPSPSTILGSALISVFHSSSTIARYSSQLLSVTSNAKLSRLSCWSEMLSTLYTLIKFVFTRLLLHWLLCTSLWKFFTLSRGLLMESPVIFTHNKLATPSSLRSIEIKFVRKNKLYSDHICNEIVRLQLCGRPKAIWQYISAHNSSVVPLEHGRKIFQHSEEVIVRTSYEIDQILAIR